MSNNNTAANPTVPETSGDLPFKLDVRVRPIAPMGNLLAYANVTIGGCFKIDGFRICSGEKGLYVNMPSTQDNKGNWRDVCWPVTADFRRQLNEALIEGYGAAIENLQATLEATKGAAEKPSLTGALKENAGKVKSQPVKAGRRQRRSLPLMPETKKYGIIYADPPWRYDMKRGHGVAENHYPTMSIEEICALPVADLAAKDSALFLWGTFPQLKEAFRVIDAWGFQYKTLAFLWLKQNRKADTWFYGMGFWTRSNAEVCLLATRGHPKRQSAGIHQFVISHIEQHSKKPDIVRDKIVKLMGDQPRVELFARQKTPGWDVWGNEVDCTITLPAGKEEI